MGRKARLNARYVEPSPPPVMNMQPIAEGLFTDAAQPQLIGGRDTTSGRIVFPCPANDRFEPVALPQEGTLWSYTIQRFRPKSPPYSGPEAFSPWAIGYVELPGATIVEARIVGVDFEDIAIGMKLHLTATPLDPDDPSSPAIPAFAPAGDA